MLPNISIFNFIAMTFFALLVALLLAHFQPWIWSKKLSLRGLHYGSFFQRHFNAGAHQHGRLAWLVAALPPLFLLCLASIWLDRNAPLLLLLLNIVTLYGCMGFRLFSIDFAKLQPLLRSENLDEARALLAKHTSLNAQNLSLTDIPNLAIQYTFSIAQRKVFGVMLWFVLFSLFGLGGAAGALLYRLTNSLHTHWTNVNEYGDFSNFAQQMWRRLNWLPQRVMAIIFAIVGDFEDTLESWRSQAAHWPDAQLGIVLACGAAAVGTRLSVLHNDVLIEVGIGEIADADAMQSIAGLLWRAMMFWLIFVFALSLAQVIH
jgi:adenosylcobinamide-phosphate synthase